MTIPKTIEMARKFLKAGNARAYAQLMSAEIRAAMSDRAANAYRKAIAEDGTESLFSGLSSPCPTAA